MEIEIPLLSIEEQKERVTHYEAESTSIILSEGNWLGLNSAMPEIASSGPWNRHGLQGQSLSDKELERVFKF